MKKLDDLSIFQKKREWRTVLAQPPQFIYNSGYPLHDDLRSGTRDDLPFYCRLYTRCTQPQTFCQRRIRPSFLALQFVFSGNFFFRIGKTGYLAEAGDLFIFRPGLEYDLLGEKKTDCSRIGMIFTGVAIADILRMFQLEQTEYVYIGNMDRFLALTERLRNNIEGVSSTETGEINAGTSFEIFQLIADEKKRSPIPPDICRIMSIMEEHIGKPLLMKDLAKNFGMSLPTLNAKFREYLHQTPYQHLIHLRMQRAVSLLASMSSIKEIAVRCGYPTPLHFSAEFKRCFGMSPRKYRREKLGRIM